MSSAYVRLSVQDINVPRFREVCPEAHDLDGEIFFFGGEVEPGVDAHDVDEGPAEDQR